MNTGLLARRGAGTVQDLVSRDAHDEEKPRALGNLELGEYHGHRKGWHPDYTSWQAFHAGCFVTGGVTFILGTVCLFFPGLDFQSAVLYIIGSCAFLAVDVQEFFTFEGSVLRANIAMSMIGSFLYVVGSVGFLPSVFKWSPAMGVWGFIWGSAVIGVSQAIKTHRIGAENPSGRFQLRHILANADARTAAGVETGACVGAWCFFFGTGLFYRGPLDGPASVLGAVLWTWVAGSCCFSFGGCCLAYRHFVMKVV